MSTKPTTRQMRSFGLTVGGVFCLIGLWPILFRGGDPRWWALALASLLIIPAMVFPKILEPAYRGWMAVGSLLGWINTRIILGALFYSLVLFTGLLLRLMGKDPMCRRLDPDVKTYKMPRQFRPASHMQHQF